MEFLNVIAKPIQAVKDILDLDADMFPVAYQPGL